MIFQPLWRGSTFTSNHIFHLTRIPNKYKQVISTMTNLSLLPSDQFCTTLAAPTLCSNTFRSQKALLRNQTYYELPHSSWTATLRTTAKAHRYNIRVYDVILASADVLTPPSYQQWWTLAWPDKSSVQIFLQERNQLRHLDPGFL